MVEKIGLNSNIYIYSMKVPLLLAILLVYLASLCYVIAAYYHLSMVDNWTLLSAMSIAIPIVCIEYLFSLPGNHYLHKYHDLDPIQILIITIVFYFINLWLLNVFVLKKKIRSYMNEMVAFVLIISAFYISNVF
jgi:uncharacterized protein (DUF486 family)